jgi:hypothetical protein
VWVKSRDEGIGLGKPLGVVHWISSCIYDLPVLPIATSCDGSVVTVDKRNGRSELLLHVARFWSGLPRPTCECRGGGPGPEKTFDLETGPGWGGENHVNSSLLPTQYSIPLPQLGYRLSGGW